MAMGRTRQGWVALLLLGVWLTTFCHSATAQCSAAESAALLKFKSVVLDPRGDLATWTGEGANCCSWRVRVSSIKSLVRLNTINFQSWNVLQSSVWVPTKTQLTMFIC